MGAPAYPITRKWIVPAGGSATLQTIINDSTLDKWVIYAAMRPALTNSGVLSWADPDGEEGGYLQAGETGILGDDLGHSRLKDFTLKGTASDVIYMTIGISASGVTV